MHNVSRRLTESAGMLLIGDGVLGLLYPREHCLLWRGGPRSWRNAIDWFAAHPDVAQMWAATEVAIGLWHANSQMSRRMSLDQPSVVS